MQTETLIDRPLFTRADAFIVTGIPRGTLNDFYRRGIFWNDAGDRPAQVSGATARLSLRSLVRLAIASELAKYEMPLEKAFKMANAVTGIRLSNDQVEWLAAEDDWITPRHTDFSIEGGAGLLWDRSLYSTVLVCPPGSKARVECIKHIQTVQSRSVLEILLSASTASAIIIRIEPIYDAVIAALPAITDAAAE